MAQVMQQSIQGMPPMSIMPSSLFYYNGNLSLPLTKAAESGTLQFLPGSAAQSYYEKTHLSTFGNLHNQTGGDPYGGRQRNLIPAAYNFVIKTTP